MSELEALNMMLRAIGSRPVNTLLSKAPDVEGAKATLNRIRLKAQRRGWWFNTDYCIAYEPDANGEITIGKSVTTIIFESDRYTRRANHKVYDKIDQTYVIGTAVNVHRIITMLPWESLPDVMADHIAYYATAEFVRDEIEDQVKKTDFMKDAGSAMVQVKKEHLESMKHNVFKQNRILGARGGVQPYWRNSRRYFSGTPDK